MEPSKVMIDSSDLGSLFDCGICYVELTEPTVTRCGHTYCRACIKQSLRSSNRCPECKAEVRESQLVKNFYIENMKIEYHRAKENVRNKYLTNAMEANGIENSPFVGIFVDVLKSTVEKFQNYYDAIKKEMNGERKKLEKLIEANGKDEDYKKLNEILDKEKQIKEIIIEEYKNYMVNTLIEPKLLPISVTITISSKDYKFVNIKLRPQERLNTIKEIVVQELEKTGTKLIEWGNSIEYIITNQITNDPIQTLNTSDEKIRISKTKIATGCLIDIKGKVITSDDVCTTLTYDINKESLIDYYRCNKCNINWICPSCIKNCHVNHDIKIHIKAHKPDRPYCCCNKACLIPNKKKPKID